MRAIISGREFDLERRDVERQARLLEPEPIQRHFVEIGDARYPVKQIVAALTGLDRNAFTSQQARAVLLRLGLRVGALEVGAPAGVPRAAEVAAPYGAVALASPWWELDAGPLAAYAGRWVAIDDAAVVVAGASPAEVTAWLRKHGVRARRLMHVGSEPLDLAGTDLT